MSGPSRQRFGIALRLLALAGALALGTAPRALAQGRAGAGDEAASDDVLGDLDDTGADEPEAGGATEDAEPGAEGAAGGEPDASPDGEAAESDVPAEPASAVRTEIAAGLGVGSRGFVRPTRQGAQRLPDTVFPAADAALRVHVWPEEAFSLAVLLRYQTSLGLEIEEQPPFAFDNVVAARAERVELSAAPTLRLGSGESALALAFPIGATMRTLWPELHEQLTPGYSLIGPHARAEVVIPIATWLTLRLGPEIQAIVAIDESLRNEGVDAWGLAYGGEALLQIRLDVVFALELTYRESHATVATVWIDRDDFEDVERFATLRLSGGF